MAVIPGIPSVVQDIVETDAERDLYMLSKEMERPPYWRAEEGMNARLGRALRVILDGRLTPNSDGSYTIEGREGHAYRVREHCQCPDSTYRKDRGPCYHEISVVLYVEWCRRRGTSPQGVCAPEAPLPLGPATEGDRLAQAVGLGLVRDSTALASHHTPQEDRMDDDETAYIPEPEDASVAVQEPATPAPIRVTIPAEYVMQISGKRHVLYAGLVIGAQRSGLVSLSADWTYNDAELSLAHAVATFRDGRRYEDSGDASPSNVTKGIAKHFRRVALTRAKARCLRDALGIQECSVEELEEDAGTRDVPDMTRQPSEKELRSRIWALVKAADATITTREAVAAFVHARTGYVLEPDHYAAIVAKLTEAGR